MYPHNAHRNGLRIHTVGADLKQLTNALCMELATTGSRRQEHIDKNEALIKRAGGLLPPINGSERYITLGCGHTVTICKQAQIEGRTSEKALQRADDECIDLQMLCKMVHTKS